jgi:hypothetical protein
MMSNLFVDVHVQSKIYREFYRSIIYIAYEERHVRIINFFYSHCAIFFICNTQVKNMFELRYAGFIKNAIYMFFYIGYTVEPV